MTYDIEKIDIKKFNDYCATVLNYADAASFKDVDGKEFDPYHDLYQLAAVVEGMVEVTENCPPPCTLSHGDNSLWKSWGQYILDVGDYHEV